MYFKPSCISPSAVKIAAVLLDEGGIPQHSGVRFLVPIVSSCSRVLYGKSNQSNYHKETCAISATLAKVWERLILEKLLVSQKLQPK